jgi:hypothetical protein
MDKLRLIIVMSNIKSSEAVLNKIETSLGWPLTRTYPVEKMGGDMGLTLSYLTASRRWMKAQYLLSLYLLIVRVMSKSTAKKHVDELVTANVKSLEEIFDILRMIPGFGVLSGELRADGTRPITSIPAILSNYDRLFASKSTYDIHSLDGKKGIAIACNDGIRALCKKEISDKGLLKEIEEAERLYNLKQEQKKNL